MCYDFFSDIGPAASDAAPCKPAVLSRHCLSARAAAQPGPTTLASPPRVCLYPSGGPACLHLLNTPAFTALHKCVARSQRLCTCRGVWDALLTLYNVALCQGLAVPVQPGLGPGLVCICGGCMCGGCGCEGCWGVSAGSRPTYLQARTLHLETTLSRAPARPPHGSLA